MSKYKFSLHPRIKGFVEWQLEHYPEEKAQLERKKSQLIPSATASYSQTGGVSGGQARRQTEDIAIRIESNQYIKSVEQSISAIEKVLSRCNKIDMQLIDLIYWKRAYTPEGAGIKIGLSKSATYQHLNSILGALALEMGYVDI